MSDERKSLAAAAAALEKRLDNARRMTSEARDRLLNATELQRNVQAQVDTCEAVERALEEAYNLTATKKQAQASTRAKRKATPKGEQIAEGAAS